MDSRSERSKPSTSVEPSVEILTAKEVASFLKISVKTVYSYASREMMPVYWKYQANIRFEKNQILEWMQKTIRLRRLRMGAMPHDHAGRRRNTGRA